MTEYNVPQRTVFLGWLIDHSSLTLESPTVIHRWYKRLHILTVKTSLFYTT